MSFVWMEEYAVLHVCPIQTEHAHGCMFVQVLDVRTMGRGSNVLQITRRIMLCKSEVEICNFSSHKSAGLFLPETFPILEGVACWRGSPLRGAIARNILCHSSYLSVISSSCALTSMAAGWGLGSQHACWLSRTNNWRIASNPKHEVGTMPFVL